MAAHHPSIRRKQRATLIVGLCVYFAHGLLEARETRKGGRKSLLRHREGVLWGALTITLADRMGAVGLVRVMSTSTVWKEMTRYTPPSLPRVHGMQSTNYA